MIDQAELFRRGIDAPKSIVHIEVDPKNLTQEQRDLIADRLIGIDVCELGYSDVRQERVGSSQIQNFLIKADGPEFIDLMKAIIYNENNIRIKENRPWVK